jgi:hypothetical protein
MKQTLPNLNDYKYITWTCDNTRNAAVMDVERGVEIKNVLSIIGNELEVYRKPFGTQTVGYRSVIPIFGDAHPWPQLFLCFGLESEPPPN